MATAITALEGRLKGIQKTGERPLTDKEELALRLNKQYPQDVGVLSVFFLNLVKLQAGQVCNFSPCESSRCCHFYACKMIEGVMCPWTVQRIIDLFMFLTLGIKHTRR